MSEIGKQKRIDEMRRKLYARNATDSSIERHTLEDSQIDVARDWKTATPKPEPPNATDLRSGITAPIADEPFAETIVPPVTRSRRYRTFILAGSLLLFVLVAGLSSLYLYFGGNQISGNNIGLVVTGPRSVGGGETLSLQVAVTNDNNVSIEAATLIVKYPPGTMSTEQPPRALYEERIRISDIQPGEVRNIPVRAVLYGDENTRQTIGATLEYRIIGSNGTFYKDADDFSVLIGSTPLVLRLDHTKKIASGQVADVTITAVSNAPTPLYNVLVSAEYPEGFSYQSSTPEPVFGSNVWRIKELLPEQSYEIKLQGRVVGLNNESFRVHFTAGPADQDNQYRIGSLLVQTGIDFDIERPFIDVSVAIDNKSTNVILEQAEQPTASIEIVNTLDETVYDMVVEVQPDGTALSSRSIVPSNGGFYDTNTGTVRWEVSNNSSLGQVFPGDYRELEFTVNPTAPQKSASFEATVNVYARRVAEQSAAEELLGTARIEAKYASELFVGGQASYSVGPFQDNGPVPPQASKLTTYTLTVVAEAGVNDVIDGVVETSLPVYIDWLDEYVGDGTVTYNTVNKQLRWEVGSIDAKNRKELTMQLGLQPSLSQVGSVPTLINKQTFRATDNYTQTLIRATAPAITTELSTEFGYEEGNGRVVE